LEEFHFQYYEYIDYDNESSTYLGEPNQFWIAQQWIFEAAIDIEEIIYSICPYTT